MRILSRDEAERWEGSPNFHLDDPPYLFEPGDIGYVATDFIPRPPSPTPRPPLQPPDPALQPPRPLITHASITIPDHANPYVPTMNPLQYIILPNPRSTTRPFRARVKTTPQIESDQFLLEVAADAGVDRATIEKVVRSLFKVMIAHLRQSQPIGMVLGLFRAFPSITGSYATNTPSADEVKSGVDFTIAPGPEADALMSGGLDVEKAGEQGLNKPTIDSIALNPGGQVDVYSPTMAMRVSGVHFRKDSNSAQWPLVQLLDSNMGNPTHLIVTACSETELVLAPVPTGLTGTRYLKITAGWDAELFTVSGPLSAHA